MLSAGCARNVIPDEAQLQLDVRILPGQTDDDVIHLIREILGDLNDSVEISVNAHAAPSSSPVGTPLWRALERSARDLVPDADRPLVEWAAGRGAVTVPLARLGRPVEAVEIALAAPEAAAPRESRRQRRPRMRLRRRSECAPASDAWAGTASDSREP